MISLLGINPTDTKNLARPITFQHNLPVISFPRGSTQTRLRLELYSGDWHEPWILGDGIWVEKCLYFAGFSQWFWQKIRSNRLAHQFSQGVHPFWYMKWMKWEYWGELSILISYCSRHEIHCGEARVPAESQCDSRCQTEVILEWSLSFGGITVVISYCISEIVKQKQENQLVIKDSSGVTVSVV